MVWLPQNEKQTYRLNSRPQMWPMCLILAMTSIDLWIFKIKCDLDLWPQACPWGRIFMAKFLNSCISKWEGRLTLNKGGGSRSFMTMNVTIWWPRSRVKIYQIVTGVTSDVGMLSTHLAYLFYFMICFSFYSFFICSSTFRVWWSLADGDCLCSLSTSKSTIILFSRGWIDWPLELGQLWFR